MTTLKRALLCLLSAGWLVPAWLALVSCLDFWQSEIAPALLGKPQLNSFPFLPFARECLTISLLWLGLAILLWSWKLSGPSASSRRP